MEKVAPRKGSVDLNICTDGEIQYEYVAPRKGSVD